MKAKLLPADPTTAMIDAMAEGFSDYFGIDASSSEFKRIYTRVYEAAAVPLLKPDDMKALLRVHECAEDTDSGGHDVSKEALHRLCEIGCLTVIGTGRHKAHYMTTFGLYCIGEFNDGNAPIITYDDYNEIQRLKTGIPS